MNIGILLGLGALVTLGLSTAISRNPVRELGTTRLMFFRGIFNSVFLLFLLFFYQPPADYSVKYIGIAILIAILGYIPLRYFYKAVERGKIGVISPISASYSIVTVILAIIFYRERILSSQLLAILITIAGTMLISTNFRQFKESHIFQIKSGVPYALIAMFGWGLYFFLIKIPAVPLGPVFLSFIVEFCILLITSLSLIKAKEKITLPNRKTCLNILLVSVLTVVGTICYYQGLRIYNVSIITALAASTPLIVTSYSYFFFKEKLSVQQFVGFLFILLGIVTLSLIR